MPDVRTAVVTTSAPAVGKRGAARRFDWGEARDLYATGDYSLAELGRRFGVSARAIKNAVDDESRLRGYANRQAWIYAGTCADCGAPATRIRLDSDRRCRACWNRSQVKIRDGEAYCPACSSWKPLAEFTPAPSKRYRGVAGECRACETARRREWRRLNRDRENAATRARRARARGEHSANGRIRARVSDANGTRALPATDMSRAK